jgi:phenylpropionate dioxygenase-like ring-hydroxylating dioxygenase large terminal subunit
MERQTELALIDRLLALIDTGTTDLAESDLEQPVAPYLDSDRLRAELALLHRLPLPLLHRSELPAPGDLATHDASGVPILVVRDASGTVHAFLNACRHRGTRLVDAEGGGSAGRALECPYHGWTYRLDGTLQGVPDRSGFPCLTEKRRDLIALPCAERHGLVWVVPTAVGPSGPDAPDLDAWLGPLSADLDGLRLGEQVRYRPLRLRKRLNWKLALDLFLEAYHIRHAHARSIYKYFLDNVGLYQAFGPHQRNLFVKRTLAGLRERPRAEWSLRTHSNILYLLFPNTLLLVEPDHSVLFSLWPLAEAETLVTGAAFLPAAPADAGATRYWDRNVDILLGATEEDYALGERIQRSLPALRGQTLLFGRFEQGLARFHRAVEEALGDPGAGVAREPRT